MLPNVDNLDRLILGFALVFVRVAGLMLMAPLFGSARVPRRFKMLMAIVIAASMFDFDRGIPLPAAAESLGGLVIGLAGELALGLCLGLTVALVFIAAQWSGEMVGQQIGLNLSQVFDPQFGGGGSIVGDLSFMLTTAVFLIAGGHRSMLIGIHDSLTTIPPLSFGIDGNLFEALLDFLTAATSLALRMSAPVFVTMIVVDVAIGVIGKTIPQLNVMSAGMSLRAVLGVGVLIVGIGAMGGLIEQSVTGALADFSLLLGGY